MEDSNIELDKATVKLKNCQNEKGFDSCLSCDKFF